MIKIAVTNLKKYNEGELIFEWVELPCDDFKEVFNNIGHGEYFISDYECDEFHIKIHEYENLEKLNELAEELDNLKSYELKVLTAIIEADSIDLDDALDMLRNGRYFFYEADDFEEFIDLIIDDGFFGEISNEVREFLDYEKLENYFQHNGYQLTSTGIINTN